MTAVRGPHLIQTGARLPVPRRPLRPLRGPVRWLQARAARGQDRGHRHRPHDDDGRPAQAVKVVPRARRPDAGRPASARTGSAVLTQDALRASWTWPRWPPRPCASADSPRSSRRKRCNRRQRPTPRAGHGVRGPHRRCLDRQRRHARLDQLTLSEDLGAAGRGLGGGRRRRRRRRPRHAHGRTRAPQHDVGWRPARSPCSRSALRRPHVARRGRRPAAVVAAFEVDGEGRIGTTDLEARP